MSEEEHEWYYGQDDTGDIGNSEDLLVDPGPSPAEIVEWLDPTPLSLEEVA